MVLGHQQVQWWFISDSIHTEPELKGLTKLHDSGTPYTIAGLLSTFKYGVCSQWGHLKTRVLLWGQILDVPCGGVEWGAGRWMLTRQATQGRVVRGECRLVAIVWTTVMVPYCLVKSGQFTATQLNIGLLSYPLIFVKSLQLIRIGYLIFKGAVVTCLEDMVSGWYCQ